MKKLSLRESTIQFIDVSEWSQGIYFLNLKSETRSIKEHIVKGGFYRRFLEVKVCDFCRSFLNISKMKKNRLKLVIGIALLGCVFMFAMIPIQDNEQRFRSEEELQNYFDHASFFAAVDSSLIFPSASDCSGCHGFDPQMNGMVTEAGQDVNPHDDWESSMMANSAKDPFWRAKVSHEVLINPTHQLDLETKCTSCHAPQGHFTALLRGADHYSIDEMLYDTTAMDGVSCGACHMKSEKDLDKLFSGEANYDTSRVLYGPFESPFAPPMANFVGFRPEFSEHINDAGICASCHTLLTSSVDLNGEYTGEKFVEQATYHEWINSIYDDEGSNPTTCQGCHMPRLEESIVISANYLFLQGRSPYALHDLVGANTTMIQLLKENKEALNIKASDAAFDETLEKTLIMLQEKSIDTELTLESLDSDTAYFALRLLNKAGHKFPSGYPSRRAYVEFVVIKEQGDTLFHSGALQADYEVTGQLADATEPHFQTINSPDQVQIYELVLGDLNGDFTTVLERAHQALKDNRLPPLGFTKSHTVYDTTKIYGLADTDPDFNIENGVEGSGTDIVNYHIPLNGYNGLISVSAKVFYQALPPKWMKPMFAESTPEIDTFRTMYENADLSPVLVNSSSLDSIFVQGLGTYELLDAKLITFYPNPTRSGWINLILKNESMKVEKVNVYDIMGRLVNQYDGAPNSIYLSEQDGLYLIEVQTDQGSLIHRVLKE